jgi:ClpP class serine protease
VQKDIHAMFIALVKERRGKKLKAADKTLFSGEFWTGEESEKLGLVDGIGDLRDTLRARYGKKVAIKLVSAPTGWFSRRVPGISPDATRDWAAGLISAVEARSLWARFGL